MTITAPPKPISTPRPFQVELFVVCQNVRNQHSENRRGGVQNGGETTGDAVLTPDNEHKRQDIVEHAHAEEG